MLADLFNQEKIQLPCWIPVFIAIGILIGFNIDPLNYWILGSIISASFIIRFFSQNIIVNFIIVCLCSIAVGLLAIQLRIKTIESPIIPFDNQFVYANGRIDNITPLEHGHRILLSNLYIKKLPKSKTPYKIRLTVKTEIDKVKIGDIVKFSAILSKPMKAYLPGSYDFAQDAYFKQIGAVGYSTSAFKVIASNKKTLKSRLNNLRKNIQTRVNNVIGSYDGSIATALMLNEYNNIDKQVLKDLRASGLAHILSVSGMHLSLVAAIFFFFSRFLLNCFESIALRVHCKKIAAFISLLGSLAYLLISGMEVAAIRSFLMVSMIITAIIIDRTSNPMRAIAFAASIILIFAPENIIHPSFQMSFAAVLALIACFEIFSRIKFDFASFNYLQKCLFYLLSVSLASLIAGLATMPFGLYHFGQSSNYNILANLLAVPITTFWLMPCVVLTFLFYPLHLEFLSLYAMKFGIKLMLHISHYIASLPYSVSSFIKITNYNLLVITFGMLWFCIWNSRLRLAGIIIILLGIISQSFVKRADIFIDWQSKTIAIIDDKNNLVFLSKALPKFKKQLLMNQLGVTKIENLTNKIITCHQQTCSFNKNNHQVLIDLKLPKISIYKDKKLVQTIENQINTSFIYLK